MKIFIIKLLNGSEILGEVKKNTTSLITLSNPLQLSIVSKSLGTLMSLYRFMPFSEKKEFTFKKKDIMCAVPAKKEVAAYYKVSLDNIIPRYDEQLQEEINTAVSILGDKEGLSKVYESILNRIDTSHMPKQ